MICSLEDEIQNSNKSTLNRTIKKRKNKNRKKKKKINANLQDKVGNNKGLFPNFPTMSVLTNFTTAATWQIQHELNFWKARAKAFEYENGILRDIIRNKDTSEKPVQIQNNPNVRHDQTLDYNTTELVKIEEEDDDDDDDTELDEEFLKFIEVGVKFRAERDRQRLLKAENVTKAKLSQNDASQNAEDTLNRQKKLYGEQWQKVSALELYLQSKYNNAIEQETPQYWPIVPLNLNCE